MADGVEITLSGLDEVFRYLDRVKVKTRSKIIGPAVRKMLRPLVTSMRARVPVRFGFLKRSLGIKQKRFRGGRVVWSRIAPRTGFRFRGEFIVNGRQVKADPVKYAHLVEFGNPSHGMPAQSFSRSTFNTQMPAAVRNFGREVQNQIERLAAREAKRAA